MPNRSSSGPSSSGRRGSGRRNSSGKPAGRGKSPGKPFKKSDSGNSERRSSSDRGRPSSFGNKRGGVSKGPREEKPFKKFDRKDDGGDRPRGNRSSGSGSRPFKSRSDSGEGFSDRRKKTFGDRERGDGKSFRRPGEGDAGKAPFKPRRESGGFADKRKSFGNRERGEAKPFRRRDDSDSEKGPFKQRKESGDSSAKRNFGGERGDRGGKSFRKRDEGSADNKPFRGRSDGSARGTFKKSESKGFDNKRDKPETEDQGFFKKSKERYSRKPPENQKDDSAALVQTEKIRLNRYIANSGVCSRREADELISMGLVSVNGKTITEMGYKVNPGDEVRYENKVLKAEKPVYILLNKPKGYLTTTDDPQERNTVMQLIGNAVKERIYPVGRLDRNTTGLLLLTNDGDLADKLMHPSYNVKKIYKVELDRPLTKNDFQAVKDGVMLEEGRAMVDDLAIVSDDGRTVGVEIHIGWNRVVRRIFEALGYQVVKLDRSVYAGLDKKDLGRGEWRFLKKEELVRLKHYK
jgi:23S rRNA pseudouridine2605 synthase